MSSLTASRDSTADDGRRVGRMTELIVALDSDRAIDLIPNLARAGIRIFKLGVWAMLQPYVYPMAQTLIFNEGADWFADLKLYDTSDTVRRTAKRAFAAGAKFLTVHATPSMLEAAMAAKPAGDYHKVIAVGSLTDDPDPEIHLDHLPFIKMLWQTDGIICPVRVAKWFRNPRWGDHGADLGKLLICPGIRPLSISSTIIGAHVNPATPAEARDAGADYIVVGRPIYDAPDPVAAARAIMEELR